MAGGVLKGFGGLFLALGVLLLLAGGGAAAYGAYDQQQNEDGSGPFGVAEDTERSDQDEALLYGGTAAAGLGLVLVIVGIVLLVSGGSRARRAELRVLAGAAAGAPTTAPPPTSGGKAAAIAGVSALALLAIVGVALLANAGGDDGLLGLSDSNGPAGQHGFLGEAHESGHMAQTATVLGISNSVQSSAVPLQAPQGTWRLALDIDWTPATLGAQQLQVLLEVEDGGQWTRVAESIGPPVLHLDVSYDDDRFSGTSLRVRVFPAENGAAEGQDFTVDAWFYAQA